MLGERSRATASLRQVDKVMGYEIIRSSSVEYGRVEMGEKVFLDHFRHRKRSPPTSLPGKLAASNSESTKGVAIFQHCRLGGYKGLPVFRAGKLDLARDNLAAASLMRGNAKLLCGQLGQGRNAKLAMGCQLQLPRGGG